MKIIHFSCKINLSNILLVRGDKKVWLNRLNDIHTDGRCSYCGHRVTRILEFGEDKSFYDKAMEFRMSLGN